jgi:hypothetical protein
MLRATLSHSWLFFQIVLAVIAIESALVPYDHCFVHHHFYGGAETASLRCFARPFGEEGETMSLHFCLVLLFEVVSEIGNSSTTSTFHGQFCPLGNV